MYSRHYGIVSGLLAMCLAGGGCTDLYNPRQVSTLEEAGSTHMAVLSVAPWATYRDAIQPQFALTADGALQQVLPNTADYQQQILEAFAFRLKAGLPSTSTSATTLTHRETGLAPTVKSDVTQTVAPGDASKIDLGPAPTSGSASGLPGSALGTPLGFDPMMKYWAALALYQEVQLVNRYLRDAAISASYAPYLVRLQVTFMPRTRDEPYDVYSTISFFGGDFPDHVVYPRRHWWQRPRLPSAQALVDSLGKEGPPWTGASSPDGVRIIPLLVTDDIETAIESRSVERVQQFALALEAMIQGVSAAADVQNSYDKLQAVVAHNYNSQFTVARASENTLRVRFGAAQQAAAHYAAIPQTHNVTLLVLVPKADLKCNPPRYVHLVSKMTMLDAKTGEELPAPGTELDAIRKALRQHGITWNLDDEQVSLLSRCVFANDYRAFVQIIGDPNNHGLGGMHFRDALWTDLATLHGLNQYQTAIFELPVHEPRILLDPQTPVVMDDKKCGMTATIGGATDISPNELTARLKVTLKFKADDKPVDFSLPATALTFNEAANQLVATFASVAASGKTLVGQPTIELIKFPDSAEGSSTKLKTFPCLYILKTPAPTFDLATSASSVRADSQGRGKLQVHLTITKTEKGVTLTLKGADVASVTPVPDGILSTDKEDPSKLVVKKSGVITLDLYNLSPTEKVILGATDETAKTSAPDITLSVVESSGKSVKSGTADEQK
jgi:hypothetical protein